MNSFVKVLKLLNANENPAQLAGAIVLSMILAVTPFWSLHNLVVVFLICILRINLFTLLLTFPVWSGIAWLIDPFSIMVGEQLLFSPALEGLWTALYQSDLMRLAHFNNTLTLGSLLVSLVLALPTYFLSVWLINRYRKSVLTYVQRLRIVQALKASSWYQRIASAYATAEAIQ